MAVLPPFFTSLELRLGGLNHTLDGYLGQLYLQLKDRSIGASAVI